MEARCVVETWAEFGCPSSGTAKVVLSGTDVLLCTGGDEVHVFNSQELKLTAVLQFPDSVRHLVQSEDQQRVYAVCENDVVYCVNLSPLLSRTPTSLTNQSPDPVLLKVSSDSLAVRDEGVRSLILVGATLLTLSLRDSAWWFTFYRAPESSSTTAGLQKLTEFSLPVVLAGHHDDSEENNGRELVIRPVLACVYSSDAPPPSTSSSSLSETPQHEGHFLLESLLFKLLFGVDAALINSPIILCGLPDGRLCCLPLRSPGQPGPRVRVLHSLEQPIMYIGTSVVTEKGSVPQCLVVMGRRGRAVLVQTCKGGPEEGGKVAGFSEGCVAGPVLCGCVDKQCLYYSTGSDLLALDLTGERLKRGGPGEGLVPGQMERHGQGVETSNIFASLQSPISLNVCRMIALAGPSHNTSGAVQLVGLSLRGRLQRLTLPKGTKDGEVSKLPSSEVGQRVKDLLAAIGDVCERASVLKSSTQSKNHALRHLNQVLNICCLLQPNQSDREQRPVIEKPIRCHAVAKWSRLLQRDSLNLTCVLDNSSPYVLERGWTLCVVVLPLSHCLTAGSENTSRTFSFPFHKLEPGGKIEVSLPLTNGNYTSYPVTVSCSLVYSLQSLLGREELARLLANGEPAGSDLGLDGGCVSLALDTLTVDWLDALQVATPPHKVGNRRYASTDTMTTDTVQAFLNSRRVRNVRSGDDRGVVATEGGLFSASVRVSCELLRATLRLGPPDTDPQGEKGPQGLCGSVLNWLLSQGPGGDERRDRGGQEDPVVYGRCPGGDTVKLTATEVTVGEASVEGAQAAVEVQVESSSMAAVCGLHHAVLSRVQALLLRAAGKRESSMTVQGLGLRRALQQAEALSVQIQESRVPEAFGLGTARGQTTKTLLSVYRQLRENPLLII